MKRLLLLLTLLAGPLAYPTADAQNCQRYKDRAEHYTNLRRAGGTSARMARWQRERNRNNTLYQDCQRQSKASVIKTTAGPGKNKNYVDRRKLRPVNTDNHVVRTLIQTCNFWIQEHNIRPTRDSLSQRDYACRAADRGQREADTPRAIPAKHTRSLSACIKPGNVIDDDVAACLEGNMSPKWREEFNVTTKPTRYDLIRRETEQKQ